MPQKHLLPMPQFPPAVGGGTHWECGVVLHPSADVPRHLGSVCAPSMARGPGLEWGRGTEQGHGTVRGSTPPQGQGCQGSPIPTLQPPSPQHCPTPHHITTTRGLVLRAGGTSPVSRQPPVPIKPHSSANPSLLAPSPGAGPGCASGRRDQRWTMGPRSALGGPTAP